MKHYGNDLKTLQELRDKSKGEQKAKYQHEINEYFMPPKPRKKRKQKKNLRQRKQDF